MRRGGLSAGCAERGRETGADLSLHGVELHPESAEYARQLLAGAGFGSEITVGDFFDVEGNRDKDLVIGNPPFVRFHDHSGGVREKGLLAAARAGVRLNELSSSCAPFAAHSLSFLADDGALGMVLPAELLYTGYAAPVRALLVDRFGEVEISLIDERVFPWGPGAGAAVERPRLRPGPHDQYRGHTRDADAVDSSYESAAQLQTRLRRGSVE